MGGLYSLPERNGIRDASLVASVTAANTATLVYTLPYDGQTAIIRKVMVNNRQSAPVTVTFGTDLSSTFAAQLPGLYAINGQDNEWTQDQLPAYEWSSAINVEVTAAAASPNDVQVMIEVELFGGSSAHA